MSGHYVSYVLVEPGFIVKSRQSSQSPNESSASASVTDAQAPSEHLAGTPGGSDASTVAAAAQGGGPNGRTDNRIWCYCSEYVISLSPCLVVWIPVFFVWIVSFREGRAC